MKQWKRLAAGMLAGMLMLSVLTGCGDKGEVTSGATDQDYPVTVDGVTLKAEPEGVAVLSGNIADVILAMDYEICLKAKSEDCTQSELEVLPVVTMDDVDAIKNAGANVVLTDQRPTDAQKEALNNGGVSVITVERATSREDLERLYGEVGAVIKGGQTGYTHGQESAENVFYTLDDIERAIPETDVPVTGCWLADTAGNGATGDQLTGTLLKMAGMSNVAEGATGGQVTLETLTIGNPQYIFCSTGVKSQLESAEGYSELTAVKEGRVYEMDPCYLEWQGRSIVEAVIFMAGTLYPELAGEASEPSGEGSSSAPEGSGSSETSSSSSSSAVATGETLQKGDTGDAVLALQQRLDELGYMFLPCSGEFGDGTEQAVKDFQYLNGMMSTGIADPETQARIYSSEAIPRTD